MDLLEQAQRLAEWFNEHALQIVQQHQGSIVADFILGKHKSVRGSAPRSDR